MMRRCHHHEARQNNCRSGLLFRSPKTAVSVPSSRSTPEQLPKRSSFPVAQDRGLGRGCGAAALGGAAERWGASYPLLWNKHREPRRTSADERCVRRTGRRRRTLPTQEPDLFGDSQSESETRARECRLAGGSSWLSHGPGAHASPGTESSRCLGRFSSPVLVSEAKIPRVLGAAASRAKSRRGTVAVVRDPSDVEC
jgi:hypothetical protein